jgi:hypothetical protein
MDDFADLLQETAAAYEKVGPFGDDQMDLIAARREIHEDRTPRQAGQVFITPESFNKDATLGRSQKIKWQPTDDEKRNEIQQSQTVAFWQGMKKEAQSMTVDVSLGFLPSTFNSTDDPSLKYNSRPFAEIEFGSDGNRNTVRCDVALGRRVTVVGNYVSVLVGQGPPGFGSLSPVILAGASIGAFAATSVAPVVLTEYVDNLAIGVDSPFIAIPLKAAVLLPIQTDLVLGETLQLAFVDFNGTLVSRNFFTVAPNSPMQPIPITGDISFVQVINPGTNAHKANVRLPFQLSL